MSTSATNTLHVSYEPQLSDRGSLFLAVRELKGFDLFAFYFKYCFIRFNTEDLALEALQLLKVMNLSGIISILPAKHAYQVPYPQPADTPHNLSSTLHVTHLPQAYTKIEMNKIFSIFGGFIHANFYGKYAYLYFIDHIHAMRARHTLRTETNLVVSFAKNPPKSSDSNNPISSASNQERPLFDMFSNNSLNSSLYNRIDAIHLSSQVSIRSKLSYEHSNISNIYNASFNHNQTASFDHTDDTYPNSYDPYPYPIITTQTSYVERSTLSDPVDYPKPNASLYPEIAYGLSPPGNGKSESISPTTPTHPIPISRAAQAISHGTMGGLVTAQDISSSQPTKYSWNPLLYGSSFNFGIWNDEPSSL